MTTNNKKPLSESTKMKLAELRAAVKMVKDAFTQLRAAKPAAKSKAISNAKAASAAAIKIVANLDKPKTRSRKTDRGGARGAGRQAARQALRLQRYADYVTPPGCSSDPARPASAAGNAALATNQHLSSREKYHAIIRRSYRIWSR
jgi:hypothetical protein